MKLLILTLCVAFVAADVAHLVSKTSNQDAKILKQEQDIDVDGRYQWSIETDNGIFADAKGALKDPQSETPAQVVQGQAAWTSPDGEQISFQYIADENGYQPQGSHLPTPPPIPPEIERALRYLAEHPPKEEPRS